MALGSNQTCATRTDGTLWCWGSNWNGRLGDGTGFYELPQQVTRSGFGASSSGRRK
jgi:alpha-tubulin suppressor-like RCC1 family protein